MGNCASTGKHRFSASPDDIAVEMSSTQAAKEPPLCMIHGLMGCTMRKTGGLAFIPVRAALGLPTPSLALPTKWEADVQASGASLIYDINNNALHLRKAPPKSKRRAAAMGYGTSWRRTARQAVGSGGAGGVDLNMAWPKLPGGVAPPQW